MLIVMMLMMCMILMVLMRLKMVSMFSDQCTQFVCLCVCVCPTVFILHCMLYRSAHQLHNAYSACIEGPTGVIIQSKELSLLFTSLLWSRMITNVCCSCVTFATSWCSECSINSHGDRQVNVYVPLCPDPTSNFSSTQKTHVKMSRQETEICVSCYI